MSARVLTKDAPAQVRGAADYAANGKARIALADVVVIGQGLNSALRGFEIEADMLFTHDAGAPVSLPETLTYRIFESITLRTPGGHVFCDLGQQAGCALRAILHALQGKLPNAQGSGGAISLANGVNTTVRVKLYLPIGTLFGGLESDDPNVDLAELGESAIEIVWANGAVGGVFDSGANNERIVSGSVRVSPDLVGRDEQFRGGVLMSIVSLEASGLNERLPIAGEQLLLLIEVPVHADGITENFVTDAERDLVTLIGDQGHVWVEAEDAKTRQQRWNRIHCAVGDARGELPHHETDASPWVFLFGPRQRPIKLTHLPKFRKEPTLKVTGTDTTPRLVYVTFKLHNAASVQNRTRQAKVDPRLPNSTKTASKVDVGSDPELVQALPFKVSAAE